MFFDTGKTACNKLPTAVQRVTIDDVSLFHRKLRDEKKKLDEYHQMEIKRTLENPQLRELSETCEISTELREHKRLQFLEEKRRQRLRANNEELRQLEVQLRCAYITKELVDQKAERKRLDEAELRRKQDEAKQFEEQNACLKKGIAEEEERQQQKKQHIRTVLQQQMDEHRQRRLKEYEEVLREKAESDRFVQQLRAEDAAERVERDKYREQQRLEVEEYLRARELHKLKQQSEKVDENRGYLEFRKKREAEERRRAEEKLRITTERVAQSERIGKKLHLVESEKRHRENVLTDLLVEERKAVQDLRYRQTLQRKYDHRQQTRLEMAAAREEHQMQRKRSKEMSAEDKRFLDEQMRILAEKDKLDQLSDERRRRLVQEHKRALLAMIAEQQNQRLLKTAENLYDQSHERQAECERLHDVEAERKRLLCAQPPEVLRYLPTNSLRPEERPLLVHRGGGDWVEKQ